MDTIDSSVLEMGHCLAGESDVMAGVTKE